MSSSSSISTADGSKATSPLVSEERIPIGCADLGKLFKIIRKSSSIIALSLISSESLFN